MSLQLPFDRRKPGAVTERADDSSPASASATRAELRVAPLAVVYATKLPRTASIEARAEKGRARNARTRSRFMGYRSEGAPGPRRLARERLLSVGGGTPPGQPPSRRRSDAH